MRVIVCGGRNYNNSKAVFAELDALRRKYGRLTIIQGGASGADSLARDWALAQSSVHLINEPANWMKHGRAAGPLRNKLMISKHKPDIVLYFPGGRGTADMVRQANLSGVPVIMASCS